jgi:hypothetical protein
MLTNLSEQLAFCYRRAGECWELAALVESPTDKAFYVERERGWFLLAQSYQLQERTGLAVKELSRRELPRGVTETRPCPACKQVTPVHYGTMFVCTSCHLIFEAL